MSKSKFQTLEEVLKDARTGQYAIGHFNIANLEMLRAIASAARKANAPAVMIGTSEGERDFIGKRAAVALVRAYAQEHGIPLFLNADHTKSVEAAHAAVDAGYASIHFDGSALEFEENVRQTKEVADYARKQKTDISVEGELGYLGGSSQVTQERIAITPEQMTDPQQARDFAERTGVNRLGIAIGNVHGINLEEPKLDFERLKAIREVVPESCALVLHAGSGIPDEEIKRAIALGIANIHISTELRAAWRDALKTSLDQYPEEYAPYKVAAPAIDAVKEIALKKLQLFG